MLLITFVNQSTPHTLLISPPPPFPLLPPIFHPSLSLCVSPLFHSQYMQSLVPFTGYRALALLVIRASIKRTQIRLRVCK